MPTVKAPLRNTIIRPTLMKNLPHCSIDKTNTLECNVVTHSASSQENLVHTTQKEQELKPSQVT